MEQTFAVVEDMTPEGRRAVAVRAVGKVRNILCEFSAVMGVFQAVYDMFLGWGTAAEKHLKNFFEEKSRVFKVWVRRRRLLPAPAGPRLSPQRYEYGHRILSQARVAHDAPRIRTSAWRTRPCR